MKTNKNKSIIKHTIFGNYVKNKLINVISRSHINNNGYKIY